MCVRRLRCASVFTLLLVPLAAQTPCALQWATFGDPVGTDGNVFAVASRDPDGAGPLPPLVVAGGEFGTAGGHAAARIAIADSASGTWSALGSGLNGTVRCVVWLANGDLVVGGAFTIAGGVACSRVARWTGTAWQALGTGCDGDVLALLVLQNGDVVAAGAFQNAGGQPAARIARWDGVAWSAIGGGCDATVRALHRRSNGDMVAGGDFLTAGGVAASRIATWNGLAWSALGSGVDDSVHCLASLPSGDLVAGGRFLNAGVPANRIARWNGAAWSPFGAGLTGGPAAATCVHAVAVMPNGDLVVGGRFEDLSIGMLNIARWSGTAWTWPVYNALSGADPTGYAASVMPDGRLLVGGAYEFTSVAANRVAMWNGTSWQALRSGIDPGVMAMARTANGDLFAGGQFLVAGMTNASRVARWDGTRWSALGAGVNNGATAMLPLANGNLVVGGWFTTAGGSPAAHIAQWNGTTWSPMGPGLPGEVAALGRLPNGDVIAGELHGVYRWTGSSWQLIGDFGSGGPSAFALRPNGELIVAGRTYAGSLTYAPAIGRWNGLNWSVTTVGAANSSFSAAQVLPNGDVVFVGQFGALGGVAVRNVARWNGTTFAPLGSGVGGPTDWVQSVIALADGTIAVAGRFTTAGGVSANGVARWNGTAWTSIGAAPNQEGTSLLAIVDGLVVGWARALPGGAYEGGVSSVRTPCVASAVATGTGCTGPAGPNVLTAVTAPWVGATFHATGTGMPALGFVGSIYGFSTKATPLAALLPGALPGCDLLVHPDLTEMLMPAGGAVQTQVVIPNTPTAIGFVFHHQLVAFEMVGVFQFSNITSTNALTVSVGSF